MRKRIEAQSRCEDDAFDSPVHVEVDPSSRLVPTQLYERMSDAGDVVVTAAFEESQGRTRLTLHQLFPSKEAFGRRAGVGHGARHADRTRSARRTGRLDALERGPSPAARTRRPNNMCGDRRRETVLLRYERQLTVGTNPVLSR
jgi:hypothetical protein